MRSLHQKAAATLAVLAVLNAFGYTHAQGVGSKDLLRCRQSCYQKFVHDWHHCPDVEDCKNMCITPPNINSYIPEAFSFLCWNNCDQLLGPFPLRINSALRQGSLVLADIGWAPEIANASKQCLVTWEVSGGGLMGNLLTDSDTVELSLWPETLYHVQVTCKHKETGGMRRSFKLIVDTHRLGATAATGLQAITMGGGPGGSSMYGNEEHDTGEPDTRLRILKDSSSKDFLSPYDPNVKVSSSSSSSAAPPANDAVAPTRHEDSVLRSKLRPTTLGADTADALVPQNIILAALAALALFLALLILYAMARSTHPKDTAAGASAIDREVLIRNELLPGQQPPVALASADDDPRTLHV